MEGGAELLFYVNGRKVSALPRCPSCSAGSPGAGAPGPGLHAVCCASHLHRRSREETRFLGLSGSLSPRLPDFRFPSPS